MACLNKLAIRGIRSFDDKQISVIEFFSPVTVIVGHNGSGKTTIIECLKYATTGDQPPNSRGGAFVHDPKMANEKEVKAQVKLRFHAANGTRMLVVRNLSVTVKKTSGLTMKTLESILALADGNADKGGKRGVISTKCAEMDTEIPQLLGVSKAVLENVIFCHQEDSYWPLAEPAALKKKFDDIFEATRYTKALDSIKSLRKDRMADLKAEKERLVGLSREKAHADKLKSRITDLSATIAAKEVEYEETKKQYEAIVEANQKFYDYATKFRELYLKIESLQEKKLRLQADLDEAKLNLQEVVGTDEELQLKLKHFGDHINAQKQKKRLEDTKKQDLEDELANVRKQHTELVKQHGGLVAEAEAQNQRISDREQLIRDICDRHGIKGFNISPLEREKVVEFLSRLGETQRKQRAELGALQGELRSKTEEYTRKQRLLDNELGRFKLEKDNLRDQIAKKQASVIKAERTVESQVSLPSQLHTLQEDIAEKRTRLAKIKSDMGIAQYDAKLSERGNEGKKLEETRDQLNMEISTLSLQSESRAKVDLARTNIRSKKAEITSTLETVNAKIRKLGQGKEATVETLERDVNRISDETEQKHAELESLSAAAQGNLQKAETTITHLKAQVKSKKDELRALERKLKNEVDQESLDVAIKEASVELSHRKTSAGILSGGSSVYESMLRIGKQKKLCTACNRHLDDNELVVFEQYLQEMMKKAAPEKVAANNAEMREWEEELERLQNLRPVQASRDQIKLKDLPALEKEIKEQEDAYSGISHETEEAADNLDKVKRELKDVLILKDHVKTVVRLQREIAHSENEVQNLESDLVATGSTRTAGEVQVELETLSANLRALEREKQNILADRDRQKDAVRTIENSLHSMELKERDLQNEIREKTVLEERIETMNREIATSTSRIKDLDVSISEARAPIEALEVEQKKMQNELNFKITEAQRISQDLNLNADKLAVINKNVERYVKERRGRQLEECAQNIEQHDIELRRLSDDIDAAREAIKEIDKEINASGASVANYRDNIRVRKLAKEIIDTQTEIDSHDMEEAAKARRNFEEKYGKAKEKENALHTAYSHIAGEVSSHQSQLEAWESDLKEFKDINKRYTEQLIRVKMSDMANSDLEKYAKALDNAIMKYHGLKMEEVNDTMKHLWNKTYQGTDIDGIKIRSDVEGGASKRSYNYRVVMTKDQVEMDMRGRCSAGQKMLASIIIRLALSDSFGQNCGILALDEPTNALDTENIDALAASLVDIINERKSHSNFQLIIITHDENFLRKLGQSDVMEYYWRVSRDSRQKSVIERQRFR
ncbi:DNA repair protein rad50 [Hypsizygus marmoreus]|uniref:DNA repair protein RAD50 n=1 Tax=Hypsizygus marmoreus TaxID=39966 RepID=A0A369J7H5_HYPMA|nr:DNA repair protein rad50 [Hypsizygus marmoreus]